MVHLSDLFSDFEKVATGEVEVVCDKPTLIIAMSARTGSTQLCSVLESMGVFGSPDEILNTRGVVQNNIKRHGVGSFVEYIEKLTQNDAPCFSFKSSWTDFDPIRAAYQNIFPKAEFIFLDRFDIVAQAVSLAKAIESGHWHAAVKSEPENQQPPVYQLDGRRVHSLMKTLMREKFHWESFFFDEKLMVPHLYYELISNDWIAAAKLIAKQFGYKDRSADIGKFCRLSGEGDQALIEEFKKSHGYSWLSIQ